MSQIARLHDAEITNGEIVDADDLDDEFNQIVNELNSQDTRITAIESGTATLSGTYTFSGSGSFSGRLNIARSSDIGSPIEGDFWYNSTSNTLQANINGTTYGFLNVGGFKVPSFTSAPTTIVEGNLYYDGINHLLKYRDNSSTKTVNTGTVAGRILDITKFTASGTWTKPSGTASIILIMVAPGGGGGGSAGSQALGGAGGGGGEGCFGQTSTSLGSTETVTINAAGTAGANTGGNGGNGGTVTFGSHATVNGGSGGEGGSGSSTNQTAGGAGGTGGTGDAGLVFIPGSPGGYGDATLRSSGKGGDGAGIFGGGGGKALTRGGGTTAGVNGSNYGGGASGGNAIGSTAQAGGVGAGGFVMVISLS